MVTSDYAHIELDGNHITICGKGEKHEVIAGNLRFVMYKLSDYERIMQVLQTPHSVMLKVIDGRVGAGELLIAEQLETIPYNSAGKWLILSYNGDTKEFKWEYRDEEGTPWVST